MGERFNRATVLLPNGPWFTPEPETERALSVRAVELGTLAIGMGALFLFGHGLGAHGNVNLIQLGVGATASAAVFLVPDAIQRRINEAKRLIYPVNRNIVYSEERLFEQWPSRSGSNPDPTQERKAS